MFISLITLILFPPNSKHTPSANTNQADSSDTKYSAHHRTNSASLSTSEVLSPGAITKTVNKKAKKHKLQPKKCLKKKWAKKHRKYCRKLRNNNNNPPTVTNPNLITAPAIGSFDPNDLNSINSGFHREYAPARSTFVTWTGDTATCDPGTTGATNLYATLAALNYVRKLSGLSQVNVNDILNKKAQAAALILEANRRGSHYPDSSWLCYTQDGYEASSRGLLELLPNPTRSSSSVDLYLDEPGADNIIVGHRRWLTYPFLGAIGIGATIHANSIYVQGSINQSAANPEFVSWPTRGWFPSSLLGTAGLWSFSSGFTTANFDNASVKVYNSSGFQLNSGVKARVYDSLTMPTLVWQMPGSLPVGEYNVQIMGITGISQSSYDYTVRVFDPF